MARRGGGGFRAKSESPPPDISGVWLRICKCLHVVDSVFGVKMWRNRDALEGGKDHAPSERSERPVAGVWQRESRRFCRWAVGEGRERMGCKLSPPMGKGCLTPGAGLRGCHGLAGVGGKISDACVLQL